MSVVMMDDPVMVPAHQGLLKKITVAGPQPRQAAAGNVQQDGMWANYLSPGTASPTTPIAGRAPGLGRPSVRSQGKVIIPSLQNTEGVANLAAATGDGKADQKGAVRDRGRLQEDRDAEAQPAQRLHRARRR